MGGCQRKAVMSAFLAVNGGAKANIAGDENRKLSWLQARNRRTCSHEKVYRPPPRQGSATPAGNPDFKGWIWAVVEIDPDDLSDAVERVNITLPKRVLTAADRYAAARGETRSGFLARAALETMARD